MTDTISDLLSHDDRIDKLTDTQVRDCWIRCVMVKHTPIDEKGDAVDKLAHTHDGVLRQVWKQYIGDGVPDGLTWERETTDRQTAFFDMTDDRPPEKLHQIARKKLKLWCRQSGVGVARIAHKRVNYYTDD